MTKHRPRPGQLTRLQSIAPAGGANTSPPCRHRKDGFSRAYSRSLILGSSIHFGSVIPQATAGRFPDHWAQCSRTAFGSPAFRTACNIQVHHTHALESSRPPQKRSHSGPKLTHGSLVALSGRSSAMLPPTRTGAAKDRLELSIPSTGRKPRAFPKLEDRPSGAHRFTPSFKAWPTRSYRLCACAVGHASAGDGDCSSGSLLVLTFPH